MKNAILTGSVFALSALIAAVLVITLLLIKVLWGWIIPDLFPGAAEQDLVARSISWFTAFKVAIIVALLAGLTGLRRGKQW